MRTENKRQLLHNKILHVRNTLLRSGLPLNGRIHSAGSQVWLINLKLEKKNAQRISQITAGLECLIYLFKKNFFSFFPCQLRSTPHGTSNSNSIRLNSEAICWPWDREQGKANTWSRTVFPTLGNFPSRRCFWCHDWEEGKGSLFLYLCHQKYLFIYF